MYGSTAFLSSFSKTSLKRADWVSMSDSIVVVSASPNRGACNFARNWFIPAGLSEAGKIKRLPPFATYSSRAFARAGKNSGIPSRIIRL